VVEARIALIESDPYIGLVERPEYKRRWAAESWELQEQTALRGWLLDRLEDPRYWPEPATLTTTHTLADRVRLDADFMQVAELYAQRADFDVAALVADLAGGEAAPLLPILRYTESGMRKRAAWERTWSLQRLEDAENPSPPAPLPSGERGEETPLTPLGNAGGERNEAHQPLSTPERREIGERGERKPFSPEATEVGVNSEKPLSPEGRGVGVRGFDIPVPPKYQSKDFQKTDYWRLRGGLDVPKERFVSFPHCSRDADSSLLIAWAGWNPLQLAIAIASYYQDMKDNEGWPTERLVPLLAGIAELVPWIRQWHNEPDPDHGERMGDYLNGFADEEARALGLTRAALGEWQPPVIKAIRRKRK